MPISWTAVFRLVVLLLMATHVFYLYAFARTLQEIVGLDLFTILASSSFALVMLVPLAWAAVLPDLPAIIRNHVGRRRWSQGRCPECGLFLLQAQGTNCPECGHERREPASFEFGWATARRFAVMALIAWALGCVAAESWAALDESNFAREAAAAVTGPAGEYSRARRWPMNDKTLYYTKNDGVTAYRTDLVLPRTVPAPTPMIPVSQKEAPDASHPTRDTSG